MKIISSMISIIAIPFLFLNMFGGIVSGIWLAILGQWSTIGVGVIVLLFGSFAASFLLLPSMAMAGIGSAFMSRGKNFVGYIFVILGAVLTIFVIIAFESAIFYLFGQRAAVSGVIFPTWLWSYGVATGVWGYLASQDRGEANASAFYAFAGQIAYIVLSACRIWLSWPLEDSIVAMAVPLAFPLIIGLTLIVTISNEADSPFA